MKQENPPYNGWGTDEDSLANCGNFIPTPLKKKGYDEKCSAEILRFSARLLTNDGEDDCRNGGANNRTRKFTVSCYLRDSTFMVYEQQINNSGKLSIIIEYLLGFMGGKFMERRKVMKPGQPVFRTHLPLYYAPADIYLGAQLVFNNFVFEIYDADEHTLTYMETHPAEFPYADIPSIFKRLRPLLSGHEEDIRQFASRVDPDGNGSLDFSKFGCFLKDLLREFGGDSVCLVVHEVVTLARHYALK